MTNENETPAEHLRHAISDALRHLDREAEAVGDKRFAGVARAILRGQTATLARLANVEQERDVIRDRYDEDVHDFWGLNEKAKDAETRAEAAEARLRKAEEWIQEVDHVEDCAAFDRTSSRECDCGRTAILKRAHTTTTEGERDA